MKKRKIRGIVFSALAYIFLFAPTVVLFIVNKELYIQENVTKLSMGAMVGAVYAVMILRGALKEVDKKLSTILTMAILLAITWLLDAVLADLFWFIFSFLIGYSLYALFISIARVELDYTREYRREYARIEAREDVKLDGRA